MLIIKFIIILLIIICIIFLSTKFKEIVIYEMKFLKYFLFIGIFFHEISHAIACTLTGAKIHKIHFDFYHGYVIHEDSKIPIIGPIFISLAPMIFGTFYIYLLLFVFADIDLLKILYINQNNEIIFNPNSLLQFKNILDLSKLSNWLLIYLIINLTVSFIPSKEDFKNIYISTFLYGLFILIITLYKEKIENIYFLIDYFQIHILFIFLLAFIIQLFFYIIVLIVSFLSKKLNKS